MIKKVTKCHKKSLTAILAMALAFSVLLAVPLIGMSINTVYAENQTGYTPVKDSQGNIVDVLDKNGNSWNWTDRKYDSIFVFFYSPEVSTSEDYGYFIGTSGGVDYIVSKRKGETDTNLTEEINRIRKAEGYDSSVSPEISRPNGQRYLSRNGSIILNFHHNNTDDSIYVLSKRSHFAKAVKLEGNDGVWKSYSYLMTYDYTSSGKKVIKNMYESGGFSALGAPTGLEFDELKASSTDGFLFEIKSGNETYLAGDGFYAKNSANGTSEFVSNKNQTVISGSAMNTIVSTNASKPVTVKADNIVFEFATGSMHRVNSMDFGSSQKSDYKSANNLPSGVTASNFVYCIAYNHSGELPGTAKITIQVGASYAGKTLYYSQLLSNGSTQLIQKATADSKGNITVTQNHCSTYIVTTEEIKPTSSSTPGSSTPNNGAGSSNNDNSNNTSEEGSTGNNSSDGNADGNANNNADGNNGINDNNGNNNINDNNSNNNNNNNNTTVTEKDKSQNKDETSTDTAKNHSGLGTFLIIVLILLVVAAAGFGVFFVLKKKGLLQNILKK